MSTTAIFAELLVAGTGGLVWLLVLLLAFAKRSWPSSDQIALAKEWQSVVTALAVALAYVVGVVIDRVADSLMDPIDQRYRARILGENYPVADTRLRIAQCGERLGEYLGYIRTRMRVARSAAFNTAMLSIAISCYLGVRERASLSTILLTLAAGITLSAVCIFAWLRISRTFYHRIRNARSILIPGESA